MYSRWVRFANSVLRQSFEKCSSFWFLGSVAKQKKRQILACSNPEQNEAKNVEHALQAAISYEFSLQNICNASLYTGKDSSLPDAHNFYSIINYR